MPHQRKPVPWTSDGTGAVVRCPFCHSRFSVSAAVRLKGRKERCDCGATITFSRGKRGGVHADRWA